ncbi:hypothetical protein TcCL_NonESM04210 [Trypanosoma cruzi]|nr:hypothetical protein TcCL_NonESM04210 [Trypanosoma cruzi]
MDSSANGSLGDEKGEEGRGTPVGASGGVAVGFAGPPSRMEELSEEEEEEDETVATARNMELKLSAMRDVTLTDTAGDAGHMEEAQTPPQAAVASQVSGPSSLVMASQCVSPDNIFCRHSKHVLFLQVPASLSSHAMAMRRNSLSSSVYFECSWPWLSRDTAMRRQCGNGRRKIYIASRLVICTSTFACMGSSSTYL